MKKIIVGVFSLALLFTVSQVVSASSIWNTASNDCRTVSIANDVTKEGFSNPCWTGTNISAQSGQAINVRIYYHNNSTQNATNTRIVLNASSDNHTFTGQIVSDQGSSAPFTVRVNTPSGTNIAFGSSNWLPNRSQYASNLPYGQSGTEVLSGGLNLGTIAPGWESQGSVVVAFSVTGSVTPPPSTPSGTLTPATNSCFISAGASSCNINFSWNTTNPTGTSAVTRNGGSTVATGNSGSKAFTIPYNSATFELYNNALPLDTATVSSSCTSGTHWNNSACVADVNPTLNCSISSFTINGSLSTNVSSGSSANLAWSTIGCDSVNIDSVGTSLPANGNQSIYPTSSKTYRITGRSNLGTSQSRTVSVTVNNINNPSYSCSISSFTINGSSSATVTSGDAVTLNWSSNNCNSVGVSPYVGSSLDANGSYTIYPTKSTTYRITGSGSSGSSQSRTVSLVVSPNVNPSYSCMITDFTANGELFNTIEAGNSSYLSWSTENCYTVKITPNVGSGLAVNDGHSVYPTRTTIYRLTAKGNTGSRVSRSIKVTVTPKIEERYYCSITNFTTDETSIIYGDNTRLSWDTDNCYSVNISSIGTVSTSGSQNVYPSRPGSYVLTALGANGVRQTRSLYINVGPYKPVIPVYNNCSINNFTTSQTYINSGLPVTLSWSTNNCNSVNISSIGSVSTYGSRTVYPSRTTNYLLTAHGQNGQNIIRSVSVIINPIIITPIYNPVYPPAPTPVYNSCAVTTIATNINKNSVTLNGIISNSSGYTNTYFEYGTSVNLGLKTLTHSYSGNTSFSETITGLSPNTIYYFRFVSNCQGGSLGYGAINIFRTLRSQTIRPVIIQGTTVTGSASPIMLKIEDRYEAIGKGDTIEYTVTYKNIGKSTLVNPILQVITREGIIITNASRGTYLKDTRTLTVELDNLISGEEGVIYVQGYVNSMPTDTAKIVTTAVLVYTNTNSAQENAIAYVLNIPREFNKNSLGAAAFFSGLWGFGLVGWLFIIILILIIILIIRRYFYHPAEVHVYNNTNSTKSKH